MRTALLFATICITVSAASARGDIYQSRDANGNVVFTTIRDPLLNQRRVTGGIPTITVSETGQQRGGRNNHITYSSLPFNINQKKLPAFFGGQNYSLIATALNDKRFSKDPFETWATFETRVNKVNTIYGALKTDQVFAFSPSNSKVERQYYPEDRILIISQPYGVCRAKGTPGGVDLDEAVKEIGHYTATNAFNAKFRVTKLDRKEYCLSFSPPEPPQVNELKAQEQKKESETQQSKDEVAAIPSASGTKLAIPLTQNGATLQEKVEAITAKMAHRTHSYEKVSVILSASPAAAKKEFQNIAFLYVGKIKRPWVMSYSEFNGPKLHDLYEGHNKFFTFYMEVSEVWVYNRKTGQIYTKMPLHLALN